MSEEDKISWKGLITSTTSLSRVLAGILLAGYMGHFIPGVRSTFALVAGRTIPQFWNIFTSGLLEARLSTMVMNVMAVLVLSKHIEPVYGRKSYVKFLAIVLTCSGISAFVSVYLAYALDRNESSELLFTEICGFHGVTAGLLVAVKQILPDSEISVFNSLKLRVKHLASLYVVTASIISLLSRSVIATMPFVLGGTYCAWFYLRFLQPSASEPSQKGDSSPDFSFSSFYPHPVQPFVDKVAGFVGKVLGLGNALPQVSTAAGLAAPSADSEEANRRRERGQRSLNERLDMINTEQPNASTTSRSAAEAVHDIETGHRDNGPASTEGSVKQAAADQNDDQPS